MVYGITKQLETKNVENIVDLFDENVEYYETPTEKINTIKEIRKSHLIKIYRTKKSKICPMKIYITKKLKNSCYNICKTILISNKNNIKSK